MRLLYQGFGEESSRGLGLTLDQRPGRHELVGKAWRKEGRQGGPGEAGGAAEGASGRTYQAVPREHLQQGDEVVAIAEVLIQVADVPLGLRDRVGVGHRLPRATRGRSPGAGGRGPTDGVPCEFRGTYLCPPVLQGR